MTLALMLVATACRKGDKLPKPTSDGKNTFGCRIDGTGWVPDGGGGFSGVDPISATNYFYFDSIQDRRLHALTVFASASDGFSVAFSIADLKGPGVYVIDQYTRGTHDDKPVSYGAIYYGKGVYTNNNTWYTGPACTGQVEVTRWDTTSRSRRIFSGTFSFRCRSPKDGSERTVSDGRFDLDLLKL